MIKVTISFLFNSHNIVILQICEKKQAIDFAKNLMENIFVFKEIEAKNRLKLSLFQKLRK